MNSYGTACYAICAATLCAIAGLEVLNEKAARLTTRIRRTFERLVA